MLSAIETGEKADFKATKTTLYENFFRNEEEDYNNDGKRMERPRICKDKGYNPGMYAAGKFSTEGG